MTRRRLLLSIALAACFSIAAVADVVVLKNGTIYKGSIIFKDEQVVIIKREDTGEVLKIERTDIVWITEPEEMEHNATPEEPAAASLPLDDAAARMAEVLKRHADESGAAVIAVAPFWGPASGSVALNNVLAERVVEKLRAANSRAIAPGSVEKVMGALQIERPALQSFTLAGRVADILGADAAVTARITSVGAETVTYEAFLVDAATGKPLAETKVVIAKDDEVRKLLGEKPPEPVPQPEPESNRIQSGISSTFDPAFSLETFYHKFAASKPEARAEGDRVVWRLESGNRAIVTSEGGVAVVSTRKLTDDGQAAALENDLAGIFTDLAQLVDGYRSSEVHKDVEFDSVFYGHREGIFHRFIVRERVDLTKRAWTLNKNGNVCHYAKIALVIDGSWAKLSMGESYVVSFGRWTTRDATAALNTDSETVDVKITPYGWLKWYVAAIDIITAPTRNPPKINGWSSQVVEYRTNKLIDHMQVPGLPAPKKTPARERPAPNRRPTRSFSYP